MLTMSEFDISDVPANRAAAAELQRVKLTHMRHVARATMDETNPESLLFMSLAMRANPKNGGLVAQQLRDLEGHMPNEPNSPRFVGAWDSQGGLVAYVRGGELLAREYEPFAPGRVSGLASRAMYCLPWHPYGIREIFSALEPGTEEYRASIVPLIDELFNHARQKKSERDIRAFAGSRDEPLGEILTGSFGMQPRRVGPLPVGRSTMRAMMYSTDVRQQV